MTILLTIVLLAVLGVMAEKFGADTRPGFDERKRS
jgi:hypothetical protein